jgi:ATP-dependent exoDNAse (exonuclease V) alpha subunit
MNVIEIRNTETPEILDGRARLRKVFDETYGEKASADIQQQLQRIVEKSVTLVSSSKAVFRDSNVVNQALKLVGKEGAFKDEIKMHPMLTRLVEQTVAEYPLVRIGDTGTFSTQYMVRCEQKMLALAMHKSGNHKLEMGIVRSAIASKPGISEEQIGATLAATLSEDDVTVIEGTAGAGKSFTMEAICKAYENSGYEVIGTAVSWIASTVLGKSAKIQNTLALTGLLNNMAASAKKPQSDFFNRRTVVVVDEAGMVGTEQMSELLGYCRASKYPIKVVLTGDTLQVIPIAAGAAMETIVQYTGGVRIETIRRQVLESHRVAVKRLSRRDSGAALNIFAQQEAIRWARDDDDQIDMVVRAYLSYRLTHPNGSILAVATTNEAVNKINARLREAYRRLGMIQAEEVEVMVTDTRSRPEPMSFSVGDEVVIRGNNKELPIYVIDPHADPLDEKKWKESGEVGVFNRNTGRIVGIRQAKDPMGSYDFIIDLAGETPGRVIVNNKLFHKGNNENIQALPMVHNFATTVYGSQGQTVDDVLMLDSDNVDFRYAYVGCSRHRNNLTIFVNESDLHWRLDEGQGKRPGAMLRKRPKDAKIKLGRYTREVMLNMVGSTWAKDSQNPTAMLYERRQKLQGSDKDNKNILDVIEKGKVKAPSTAENNSMWDADLRATIFSEVEGPLATATSWMKGVPLDTDSMIGQVANLLAMAKWLKETDLTEECEILLQAMNKRRPGAGIWDVKGAEDLAEQMQEVAQMAKVFVEHRQGLAQEILSRSLAGDSLSKAMKSTVEVMTTRLEMVDVEKILDIATPLDEAEIVRQFEVDINRHAIPSVTEIPIQDMPDEVSEPPVVGSSGFMGRLLAHFSPPTKPRPAVREEWETLRQPDQPNPFGEVGASEAVANSSPFLHEKAKGKGLRPVAWRASKAWLLHPPVPNKKVPWKGVPASLGIIEDDSSLTFSNVPKTGTGSEGASGEFLRGTYGTWWGRGVLNEPRVFARDNYGEIVTRYALDGRLVSGDGYPPMLRNPKGNKETPIYILPGPHEMAWMAEIKFKNAMAPGGDPASLPHMVWAAKDVDWGFISKALAQRKVVIVRSRKDPSQAIWAAALQEELTQRWGIKALVTPGLEPVAAPSAPTAQAPPEPSRTRFRAR